MMKRVASVFAIAVLAATLPACFTGPSAADFRPAVTGHGTDANIRLRKGRIIGELLEVSDSGYILLNGDGLTLVMFSVVHDANFAGISSYSWGAPDPELKQQLRLVSRFPQGIPRRSLEMLLADARQPELRVVTR